MSSPEQGLPASPAESTPERPLGPIGRGGRVGRWVPVVVVLAVVVALVAVLQARAHEPTASTASSTVPAGWQTYHDPLGLFTVGIPPGWTAQGGMSGSVTFGGPGGSVTELPEGVTISGPAQGTGSAYIYILAYRVPLPFAHEAGVCSYFESAADGPFHGPPWRLTPYPGTWLVDTQNAHVKIDSVIPGVLDLNQVPPGQPDPEPTATPLPARWVATDETEVSAVLISFQPAAQPLASCPL